MSAAAKCTSLTAVSCPRCGVCTCPPGADERATLDLAMCPLHGPDTAHGWATKSIEEPWSWGTHEEEVATPEGAEGEAA